MSKIVNAISNCATSVFYRLTGRTPKTSFERTSTKPLGKGGFGAVFKAQDKITGAKLAVKVLDKTNKSQEEIDYLAETLKTEYDLSRVVQCDNILEPVAYVDDGKDVALVMPRAMCDAAELKRVTNPQIATVIKATLTAVSKLHDSGIIHRDIKAENIVVTPDFVPKLADFGLAGYKTDFEDSKDFVGTMGFVSANVKNDGYNEESDIYAIGMLAIQLAMPARQIFPSPSMRNDPDCFDGSERNTNTALDRFCAKYDNDCDLVFKDFVKRCLDLGIPSTASELLNHPFMSEALDTAEFKDSARMSWTLHTSHAKLQKRRRRKLQKKQKNQKQNVN